MCYNLCSCTTCFHTSSQFNSARSLQKALVFSIVAVDLHNEFVQEQLKRNITLCRHQNWLLWPQSVRQFGVSILTAATWKRAVFCQLTQSHSTPYKVSPTFSPVAYLLHFSISNTLSWQVVTCCYTVNAWDAISSRSCGFPAQTFRHTSPDKKDW